MDSTCTKDAHKTIISSLGSRTRVRHDVIARVGCDMKPVSAEYSLDCSLQNSKEERTDFIMKVAENGKRSRVGYVIQLIECLPRIHKAPPKLRLGSPKPEPPVTPGLSVGANKSSRIKVIFGYIASSKPG